MLKNDDIPLDVKSSWMNVIRRLQSVGKSQGLAILSMSFLVDENGDPIFWTEPKRTLIEPKRSKESILQLLTSLQQEEK